jgi:hypothetical protein
MMSSPSKEPTFDVYAETYHPLFLKNINASRAQEVFTAIADGLDVDYQDYVASFAGSSFLSGNLPLPKVVHPSSRGVDAIHIKQDNYATAVGQLLYTEIMALTLSQQNYNVYNSPLKFVKADSSGTSFLATVIVPGVAE